MAKIINITRLTRAQCAVDLGDGSERGAYVDQDYILHKLHRPHRAISLMYCYYPLDEGWPVRASEAFRDKKVGFAWDYPYDDYFPYGGGIGGNTDGEPFTCMRDIRRHGQDVILTLTCDPHIGDEHIVAIAKELRPFGRMMLRLNHECTGNWFAYTKRSTYQEIADFFVRFKKIMAEYAPNVRMILCAGASIAPDRPELEMEDIFKEAGSVADIWSVDRYIALNWGWPFEVAEKTNFSHKLDDTRLNYEMIKLSNNRYRELYGVNKPFVMSELNADGDVTGPYKQTDIIRDFYELVRNDPDRWVDGITMYQFRDDGRLGLEFTDPSNRSCGIEWPLLKTYRDIINDDFFRFGMEDGGEAQLPVTLRWGGTEDSEGAAMELQFEGNPVFAEANFPEELATANLMLELNGYWFYKAPGTKFIDFMPAFYEKPLDGKCTLKLNIFAPPASGENDESQGKDWAENYYYTMTALPDIRLRFEPVL